LSEARTAERPSKLAFRDLRSNSARSPKQLYH
jgi:hypothetical protein